MSIPVRYIGTGDEGKAKTLIPYGRKLINFLKRRMSFNDLPTDRLPTIKLHDGTTIDCSVNYGLAEVRIHVPGGLKQYESEKECLCLPHFSMAIITKVYDDPPGDSFLREDRFQYDLLVCAKTMYLFYEKAYDANFGRYYKGQFVMVTIGAEMDSWTSKLDCDRICLAQKPRFEVLMISPVHVIGEMREWKTDGL